jgi:exodeoxyribonuclease VII large subunit
MSRTVKSQWDFGDLFENAASRRVLTVSELTAQVKRVLEKELGPVWVTGEVSNLRVQSSGHIYFTLKDAGAQLNAVLFRGEAVAHREALEDGRKVIVQGSLTVYEPRGQYQLIVRAVELHGVGALQLAFERLKRKLQAEGLFAPERKRPLPKYPRRLGLVTSPAGAALRDVLHVIQRRNPGLEIILAPCRVQGAGAAEEIAAAIRLLNQFNSARRLPAPRNEAARQAGAPHPAIDVLLVTRGGGSLEDLWAFNEEIVARAICESALPVVSAVGHEIDFTISDFVADLRAATPSAAAEILTEGVFACRQFVAGAIGRLSHQVRKRLDREQDNLATLLARVTRAHPRRRLNEKLQRLDDLQTALLRSAKFGWRACQSAWLALEQRLARVRPRRMLERRAEALQTAARQMNERLRQGLKQRRSRFHSLEARLRLLSPANVLERGYSITTDLVTGQVIRDPAEVQVGQRLKTRVKRGEIRSRVERD